MCGCGRVRERKKKKKKNMHVHGPLFHYQLRMRYLSAKPVAPCLAVDGRLSLAFCDLTLLSSFFLFFFFFFPFVFYVFNLLSYPFPNICV